MSLISAMRRAVRYPGEIVPGLFCLLKRAQIKQVERDGVVYYVYQGEYYPAYLHHGNAAAHILEVAKPYCHGAGIDIGANQWPFPGAEAVDDRHGENAYRLERFATGSLDYVFSSHCLEHLARWQDALRLWIGKLRAGGVLFLYLPHESMRLWRPGGPWVGGRHKWSPTWQTLVPFLKSAGMEILDYNAGCDDYWSFHVVARRVR